MCGALWAPHTEPVTTNLTNLTNFLDKKKFLDNFFASDGEDPRGGAPRRPPGRALWPKKSVRFVRFVGHTVRVWWFRAALTR